jgi:DeoR family suf operon transcriptional repressor
MWEHRFFQSTRGKVLFLLKKRGACTVAYLSHQLELTPNAIRQHLSALERDNLVTQQPVKTGPNKPALAFSLAPNAESLFPKRYGALLSKLVENLERKQGRDKVCHLLSELGESLAERYVNCLIDLTFEERMKEVGRIMEESGSIPDWEINSQGWVVRDFNCPYSAAARAHPSVCEVQRSFLQRLLGPTKVTVACQQQEGLCGFQIKR